MTDNDLRLEKLLERYIESVESGNENALDELCLAHPEDADQLRHEVAQLSRYWQDLENMGSEGEENPSLAGKTLGRFKIIRELGRGGMGIVCLVEDPHLNRQVALKILHGYRTASAKDIHRFRREIQAIAKLKHHSIIPVYEVGEDDGAPFFTMEYVEGQTLDQAMTSLDKKTGRVENSCLLMVKIAEALHHAHEQGIIHRDVKPSNILLDNNDRAFLFDFGLALIENEPALTHTGDFIGTPFYVSPEQVKGKSGDIDHRTDIYSLGVTLYEVLTGERPFTGDSSQQIFRNILSREPMPLRSMNDSVPRDLETICLTALEKDPARRYQNAQEFADDLTRFLDYRPVLARPVGRFTKASRFIRRHRLLVGSTAVVLVAIITGLVVSLLALGRANREWVRAEKEKSLADLARANVTAEKKNVEAALEELSLESRRTAGVREYLEWMLQSIDPDRFGRNVQFLEVVRAAAESLSERFEREPEIEASLRLTLATSFRRLGAFEEAEQQLVLLEPLESMLSLEPEELIRARSERGRLRRDQGQWGEAVTIHRANVAAARRLTGESSVLRDCLGDLGRALHDQGHWAEAVATFREALALCTPGDDEIQNLRLDLSHVLQDKYELQEAREILDSVWKLRKEELGEDHFETLRAEHQLGFLSRHLNELEEAESHLTRAREGYRKLLGLAHPLTLQATRTLAHHHLECANYPEAERIITEALVSIQSLEDNEWLSLDVRATHALLLYHLGRLKEATAIQSESVREIVEALGEVHPKAFEAERQYGFFLTELGQLEKAETLLRKTFTNAKSLLGNDHPLALRLGNVLGVTLELSGSLKEAEALQRDLLSLARVKCGESHSLTHSILMRHASLLKELGSLEECEASCSRIIDARTERFGQDHPSTLEAMDLHALAVANQGRFQEAVELFDRVTEKARSILNPDHPHLAIYLMNQGYWYFFSNQEWKAEKIFREVLRIRKKSLGPGHYATLAARRELAHSLFSIGGKENLDEAFSLLEGIYESSVEMLGADHDQVLRILYVTGRCLAARGEFARAEKMLLEVVAKHEAALGEEHRNSVEAQSTLARIYQRQGKYKEAEPIHRRNLEIQKKIFGPEYTATVITMNNLAHLLQHTERYPEALALNEEILDIWMRQFGEEHYGVLATYNNLTDLYLKTDRLEDADRVSARLIEVAGKSSSDHWRMGVYRTSRGKALTHTGHYDEAEKQLQQAIRFLTQTLGRKAKETGEAREALEAMREARASQED